MNSIVRPNFKEKFVKIRTCGSCEQCTGPTQKKRRRTSPLFSVQSKHTLSSPKQA